MRSTSLHASRFTFHVSRFTLCLLCVGTAGSAAGAPALPTGFALLRHIKESRAGIRDYTVDVDLHVDMQQMKLPDMSVRVFFKVPDKVKLKPLKGFAILPKGTPFTGDPLTEMAKHATARVLKKTTVAGRPAYHVELTPFEGAQDEPIQAWVDAQRWVVLKILSRSPAGDPTTLQIDHQKVGRHWLPSKMVAHVRLPDFSQAGAQPHGPRDPSAPHVPGVMRVTFSNYRLNTGLKDSLFEEKDGPAPRPRRRHRHGGGLESP